WLNDSLSRLALGAALLLTLAAPVQAEDDILGLEDTSDLEYIEIDEIMAEDENAPRPAIPEKEKTETADAMPEEEEFVDLDAILYGGDGTDAASADAGAAAPKDRKTMQQDMQALKEKVLQVNRDLFVLEEDLLYPSSTQVNVFVSFDALPYSDRKRKSSWIWMPSFTVAMAPTQPVQMPARRPPRIARPCSRTCRH